MEKFNVVPVDQSIFAKDFQFQEPLIDSVSQNKELNLERDFTLYQLSFKNIIFGLVAVNNKVSDDLAESNKKNSFGES